MRNCCYCNKRASIYDRVVKCSRRNCEYFIHKHCQTKRSSAKNETSNWTCKLHSCVDNLCINSDESNDNMALPRTPVNNDNNNEQSEVEIIEDLVDEIQHEDENTLISQNSHDNNAGDLEEDSFHEFDQSQIVRSTSYNLNPESHAFNNNNNPQTSSNLRNAENNSTIVPNLMNPGRQSATLFNNTPKRPIKTCNVCKKDASRHGFVCKGCNKVCHPICLLDEEEESSDSSTESYLCLNCMKIIHNINNSCCNSPKVDNLNNYPTTSNNLNNNQLHHDYSQNVTTRRNYDRKSIHSTNYSRNQNVNEKISLSNNSLGNSEMETYFIKLQYQKLPAVTDSDLSWTVFYSSFIRTKGLFDPDENVIRIQAAIKDETVKRIGGKGLFNPKTYEKCIDDVNKRLKNNINFLSKEASFLEKHGRIKAENKSKLVEYIDKVRNFATLAIAYKDYSYSCNRRFLANIINVVPIFIRNKWETRQAELEDKNIVPSLKHLIEIFDRELPRIEASIRNDELISSDKQSDAKTSHKGLENNHRLNNSMAEENTHQSNENLSNNPNNPNNQFYCWFHKNNTHPGNKCKSLWNLDGKTVSELAKKAKICTFCGQSQHNPCPFNANLKCRILGCDKMHHSLFCYKRKITDSQINIRNTHETKEIPSQVLEDTSSEDEEKITSTNRFSNISCTNDEKIQDEIVDNLINNQYYTNVPQTLKDHLLNYQNSQRNSHLFTNYSDFPTIEAKSDRSHIDKGSQTSIIDINLKTFCDASTQTSIEELINPNDESNDNENNPHSHNILQNCKQNEIDSYTDIKELPFNHLTLKVKNELNDKSRVKRILKDENVTKCTKVHTRKGLNSKLKQRNSTCKRNVKHKTRKKTNYHNRPRIPKIQVHKSKHKNMEKSDSKRQRKKKSNNRINHEFSKLISFIPGTKMK